MPRDRVAITKTLVIHGDEATRQYDVTLGYYADGQLGEVFVRQEKEGGTLGALLDAVATVISIGIQHGVPWRVFAEKLAHQRFEPAGLTNDGNPELRMVSSLLDYFARWVSTRVTLKDTDNA
jgi:ribonucleoside-diphosphate reductase alpha chain